jgi:hypothetical protein
MVFSSDVFILKALKVVCFYTVSEVFILGRLEVLKYGRRLTKIEQLSLRSLRFVLVDVDRRELPLLLSI